MRPENPDGTKWRMDTTERAHQEFHKKALADLHDHEERMSGGRMNAENHWSPLVANVNPDSGHTIMVPDPALVAMKHSGDDQQNLTNARWAAFCSEPQDETEWAELIDHKDRLETIASMKDAGSAVEAALLDDAPPPILEPMVVGVSPHDVIEDSVRQPSERRELIDQAGMTGPKRRSGRPKGSKNKKPSRRHLVKTKAGSPNESVRNLGGSGS